MHNPNHLYVGDPATNGLDKMNRGCARTLPRFGKDNPMYGMKGVLNPMFGKKHTEESLAKMRKSRKSVDVAARAEFMALAK